MAQIGLITPSGQCMQGSFGILVENWCIFIQEYGYIYIYLYTHTFSGLGFGYPSGRHQTVGPWDAWTALSMQCRAVTLNPKDLEIWCFSFCCLLILA